MLLIVLFALISSVVWTYPLDGSTELPGLSQESPIEDGDIDKQEWSLPLEISPELATIDTTKGKSLDNTMNQIVKVMSEIKTGLKGWEALKLDHCNQKIEHSYFICEAIINRAIIQGKQIALKFKLRGHLKGNTIDKLEVIDALMKHVPSHSHSIADISWWTKIRDGVELALPSVAAGCLLGHCG